MAMKRGGRRERAGVRGGRGGAPPREAVGNLIAELGAGSENVTGERAACGTIDTRRTCAAALRPPTLPPEGNSKGRAGGCGGGGAPRR